MRIHEVVAIIIFLRTCSAKFEPFIVNGRDASIEDFPFMAFIVYYNNKDEMTGVCGGSLLSSQTILTAAHCLGDPTKKKTIRYRRIVLMGHANWHKATMKRQGVGYEMHPEYDPNAIVFDIGVLFLTSRVLFSPTVKKTVLQTKRLEYPRQKNLYTVGWGVWSDPVNTSYVMAEKLQYLAHQYIPNDICIKNYNITLDAGTICAGSLTDHKYVFEGDSGGPLVTQDGYQVGLVSYKLEEDSHGVTIFTHIPDYINWIEKTQTKLFVKYCPDRLKKIKSFH